MANSAGDRFRTLLSTCPTWQTLTGTVTAGAAAERIVRFELDETLADVFPRCTFTQNTSSEKVAEPNTFVDSGSIIGAIRLRKTGTIPGQFESAWDDIVALQAELYARSNLNGALDIVAMDWDPLERTSLREGSGTECWIARFEIRWGLDG